VAEGGDESGETETAEKSGGGVEENRPAGEVFEGLEGEGVDEDPLFGEEEVVGLAGRRGGDRVLSWCGGVSVCEGRRDSGGESVDADLRGVRALSRSDHWDLLLLSTWRDGRQLVGVATVGGSLSEGDAEDVGEDVVVGEQEEVGREEEHRETRADLGKGQPRLVGVAEVGEAEEKALDRGGTEGSVEEGEAEAVGDEEDEGVETGGRGDRRRWGG